MNFVDIYYKNEILKYFGILILIISLIPNIQGQSLSTKGMFTMDALTSNDIPSSWPSYESRLSYIPTLSIRQNLSISSLLDGEWAYHLKRNYAGGLLYNKIEKNHRFWIRFSNQKLEIRLGLQKLIFGPTQILRPLSWFDTFDVKDPTRQTDGVNALRVKWFPSNNISIWSWLINSDSWLTNNNLETLSLGGRAELSSSIGEMGLTFHIDPKNSKPAIEQIGIPIDRSQSRLGLDYRFDGFIGFWNESTLIKSEESEIILSTIGADYTIPISNGILVMTETMYVLNKYENQNYSVIMASVPIGIIHMAMYVSQFDWVENKKYHYFRWSSVFDSYSLNMIVSLNPKRDQYNMPESAFPNSLTGFGAGIQFMLIYNH